MTGVLTCTCCRMWRVEPYPLVLADDGTVRVPGMRVMCNGFVIAVCRTVDEVAAVVPSAVFATLTEQ